MKAIIILLIATALPTIARSQGFASFAFAYMIAPNCPDYVTLQMNVGAEFAHNRWFAEYNQQISLSPAPEAAKYVQARTGPVLKIDRELSLRPFIGYSITAAPASSPRKVSHGTTVGAYLVQKVNKESSIKYELSINHFSRIIPSIGWLVTF